MELLDGHDTRDVLHQIVVLVAVCCRSLEAVKKTRGFFPKYRGMIFDLDGIRSSCGNATTICSDNDFMDGAAELAMLGSEWNISKAFSLQSNNSAQPYFAARARS